MRYQHGTEAYQHKLVAIVELANRWQERIDDDEWPELDRLLKTFSAFAGDYIGLLKQTPTEISRPKFALSRGVDKLLNEWNALSRACEQRFEETGANAASEGLPGNLRGAKRKLQRYCERWNGARVNAPYLKLGNPVVYFEKIYRLSRSVYAPHSPVISIPLTDYDPGYTFAKNEDNELRWPALAHEFGHHIYWNALDFQQAEVMRAAMRDSVAEAIISTDAGEKTKGIQRIQQSAQVAGRAGLWSQWLEEVFADTCGVLLDGPMYAVTAQDVAAERAQKLDDLKVGDFEHPAPYLRPFITLRVLEMIALNCRSNNYRHALDGDHGLISQLKQRWQDFCGQLGTQHYPNTALTLKQLEDDVPVMVDTILTGKYWPNTKKNLLERLEFQEYEKHLNQIQIDKLPSLPQTVNTMVPQVSHRPEISSNRSEALKTVLENVIARVSNVEINDTQKPGAEWLSILSLDLSDTDYYHVHDCSDDHYHGWFFFLDKSHAHPQDGSTYFDC